MGEMLRAGAGRLEWEQGAPSGDGGFFGWTREKLFEGPFRKGAKLLSVTTAQCDGRVVRERRWPSVIYCTGSPLPTNRRSV